MKVIVIYYEKKEQKGISCEEMEGRWKGQGRLHEKGRRISPCEITVEQKHRLTHRENSNPGCE